ncbi:Allantoicase [Alloactinosynnema sp. L-07]|uniref:allantoicase n=1 Tax=Alloactinosynnema sp. L-07 TaxID=1653480 RepID=UPI00065EF789|nr:allantoicase [Alloactinosynnema sp. L-07]CRK58641.1 Allantoicase [Alloactinosynnema sp. L-07]
MIDWTLPDLASRRFGGSVMWANDESFAERENLITPAAPEFRPATFGLKGQVYDGWETRRRRTAGDDSAVIRLGLPGVIRAVVVDTAFFTGNYPPECTVEACAAVGYPSADELTGWETVVPRAPLSGDTRNLFEAASDRRYTHVRLTIHPDGGVARLRVHGEPVADPALLDPDALDLAALANGGRITDCSNKFYSNPDNLLAPGQATVMGEGWETARRRDSGNDWVLVRLAAEGVIRFAELDTTHFKGNAPGWAQLTGAADVDGPWFPLLDRTRLQPDTRHRFPVAGGPVSHVRLDIYPDGGMARLRLHGGLTAAGNSALAARFAAG